VHPDRIAQKAGWLVLESNQAYEKPYFYGEWWQKEEVNNKEVFVLKSRRASLFIFKEKGVWILWRATFKSDQSDPLSERVLGKSRDIRSIISRGENFISWWENRNKKGQSKTAPKRKAN
jgi:hypothetical protein